jgi:hypothetical protein
MVFRFHLTTMRSDIRLVTVSLVFINAELNWREQANACFQLHRAGNTHWRFFIH